MCYNAPGSPTTSAATPCYKLYTEKNISRHIFSKWRAFEGTSVTLLSQKVKECLILHLRASAGWSRLETLSNNDFAMVIRKGTLFEQPVPGTKDNFSVQDVLLSECKIRTVTKNYCLLWKQWGSTIEAIDGVSPQKASRTDDQTVLLALWRCKDEPFVSADK